MSFLLSLEEWSIKTTQMLIRVLQNNMCTILLLLAGNGEQGCRSGLQTHLQSFIKKIRTESTSLYPIRMKKEKEGEKRAFNHSSTDDVVRLKTKLFFMGS
jgi:hypothetical protein